MEDLLFYFVSTKCAVIESLAFLNSLEGAIMQLAANSRAAQIVPQIQTELVFKQTHLHDDDTMSRSFKCSFCFPSQMTPLAADSNVLQVVSKINFIGIFLAFYSLL